MEMTFASFMAFVCARHNIPFNRENIRETMWKRWTVEMKALRILARNPELAAEANKTVCFSQEALRSDARYHAIMGRLEDRSIARGWQPNLLTPLTTSTAALADGLAAIG